MSPTVEVAIISSIPSTIVALAYGYAIYRKAKAIEVNTNSMNTELRKQRNEASSRADLAEGKLAGVESEQKRTKE
jgi:hypothetical protein